MSDMQLVEPTFLKAGDGLTVLDDPAPIGRENALQKLGRPPFERSARTKFRLLGFLATVFEHVADDLKDKARPGDDANGQKEAESSAS